MPVTRTPVTTSIYGDPIPTKMRAVSCRAGQTTNIEFAVLDDSGNPIDLTSYGGDSTPVTFRFKEVINPDLCNTATADVTGTVNNVVGGQVSAAVPQGIYLNQGIYYVEAGIFDTSDPPNLLLSNLLYLFVEPGLFGNAPQRNLYRMPSIQEIRLKLRDNGPEENRLIGDYEFDLSEVCDAIVRSVEYWNTSQPPINVFFNTINYPFYMPAGYISWLLQYAGYRFMRNQLAYQAGGVTVDDQNKFQEYQKISQLLWQQYQDFVKQKKVQLNMEMAMTSLGSTYQLYQGWGIW